MSERDHPDPPESLPTDLVREVEGMDAGSLRGLIHYLQHLVDYRLTPEQQITAGEGEEIVDITEREGYTEVTKRMPCANGCDACPHGEYVYEVHREGDHLHWSYIGRTVE